LGDITITGGTVIAQSGVNAAQQISVIGLGQTSRNVTERGFTAGGSIVISGGDVTVTAGQGWAPNHRSMIGGNFGPAAVSRPGIVNSVVILPDANLTFNGGDADTPRVAWAQNIFYLNVAESRIHPRPYENLPVGERVRTEQNFTIETEEGEADVIANFSAFFASFPGLDAVLLENVVTTARALSFFTNSAATSGNITFSADGFETETVTVADMNAATEDDLRRVIMRVGGGTTEPRPYGWSYELDLTENTLRVYLNPETPLESNGYLILAVYRPDGSLAAVSVESATVTGESWAEVTHSPGFATGWNARAFVWNNLDVMQPLLNEVFDLNFE